MERSHSSPLGAVFAVILGVAIGVAGFAALGHWVGGEPLRTVEMQTPRLPLPDLPPGSVPEVAPPAS